jgi:hypothetical protein
MRREPPGLQEVSPLALLDPELTTDAQKKKKKKKKRELQQHCYPRRI